MNHKNVTPADVTQVQVLLLRTKTPGGTATSICVLRASPCGPSIEEAERAADTQ